MQNFSIGLAPKVTHCKPQIAIVLEIHKKENTRSTKEFEQATLFLEYSTSGTYLSVTNDIVLQNQIYSEPINTKSTII